MFEKLFQKLVFRVSSGFPNTRKTISFFSCLETPMKHSHSFLKYYVIYMYNNTLDKIRISFDDILFYRFLQMFFFFLLRGTETKFGRAGAAYDLM